MKLTKRAREKAREVKENLIWSNKNMTLRFTEREKFRDKWYMSLSPTYKCVWEYILSECDHAGILEFNLKMMSLQIGAEITIEDLKYFERCGKIQFIQKDVIFVPNFVLFQQRLSSFEQLNSRNRCHKSILERFEKYKISTMGSSLDGASKHLGWGYSNSNSKSNSNSNSNSKSNDVYINKDYDLCFDVYSKNCQNLIPLRFERRSKAILELLHDFLEEIEYNREYFLDLCVTANKLERICDTKIDFKMLLKNHSGIMSGKYGKVTKSAQDYKY